MRSFNSPSAFLPAHVGASRGPCPFGNKPWMMTLASPDGDVAFANASDQLATTLKSSATMTCSRNST